jgi:hypothetical protein
MRGVVARGLRTHAEDSDSVGLGAFVGGMFA